MPHSARPALARWPLGLAVCLVLAIPSMAAAQATVTTDYPDYYPGDVVVVTGTGWWPGETVSLTFDEDPVQHEPHVLYSVADSAGAIENAEYLIDEHDLGTSFTLTARGESSGLSAQTFFTDSPKVGGVAVGPQSGVICSTTGGSASYEVTVTRGSGGGSSGAFTANLLVTSPLPAGITASFAPNPVSFTPGATSRTATLTLTSSGATSPGLTSFTVKASTSASDFASAVETVETTAPPSIVCPADLILDNEAGQCSAIAAFQATSASAAADLTYSHAPGTRFPVGITTVTATASNLCGSTSCTFTVTVRDVEKPTITVADRSVSTDPGACAATVAQLGALAADNCGVQNLVGTRSDGAPLGDPFPKGVTTVTWVATDVHGNTATAMQRITVGDHENPTLSAPAALQRMTGSRASGCGLLIADSALGEAAAHDNCSVEVTRSGVPADNFFPVGTTTITYTATDPSGNTATATQSVTVADNAPPTITTSDVARANDPGTCAATILSLGTTASDNCTLEDLKGTRSDGAALSDPFPAGTTTIHWVATDAAGNSSEATQLVSVADTERPTIALGSQKDFVMGPGECGVRIADLGTTATDNCGPATLVGTRSDGLPMSDPFPAGLTTIHWAATDGNGNSAESNQEITVLDREDPTVTAPAAVHVTTGPGATECGVRLDDAALGTAVANDNCSAALTRTGIPAGGLFPVGSTTITYTAIDPSGNTATATQTITVVDDTPPAVSASDLHLTTQPGSCFAAVAGLEPEAHDNCAIKTVAGIRDDGASLADPFPVGTTLITWSVTDLHGNTVSATQTVTVVDDIAPTLTSPPAVNVSTGPDAALCGAHIEDATLGVATAGDNCSVIVTRTGVPEGNLFPIGTTTITYTATDPSGNSVSATQMVTVADLTPPTLHAPPAVTVSTGADATLCGMMVAEEALGAPTATDNCSVNVTRTGVPADNLFPKGVTTITYTATDPSGNSVAATQTVTVVDATPPKVAAATLTVPTDTGLCGATIAALGAAATDNCGTPALTGVRSDGALLDAPYPKGTTVVTWTATDEGGNVGTAAQTIVVLNPGPVATITAPASGIVIPVGTPIEFVGSFTDNAGDVHTATWTTDAQTYPATVDEAAKTAKRTLSFASAGVYLVSLTVRDQCGGSSTATQVNGLDAMVVVYDPSAGFVTGGGWIDSPAGAYVPDRTMTGKANFGFVSRYKRGASVPTGETEFQFKAGALNFHSSSYEVLVISGARAQFRGAGTVNGTGNYGFLLSAVDGQITGGGGKDKFRIKIVDKTTGLAVYDNQLGAPDTSTASTLLGGGSIAIQTSGGTLSAAAPSSADDAPLDEASAANGLFQNQPNPFNPETVIGFSLARAGHVTLRVFDVRGRLIRSLLDEALPQGAHTARWNGLDSRGSRIPSGVYYAVLDAPDGYRARIRMVLVK